MDALACGERVLGRAGEDESVAVEQVDGDLRPRQIEEGNEAEVEPAVVQGCELRPRRLLPDLQLDAGIRSLKADDRPRQCPRF